MKIKRYVLILHTIFIGLLICILVNVENTQYESVDLVKLNDQIKIVEQQIELNESKKEEIEETYNCSIIYLNDSDYMRKIYQALKNDELILDYMRDGRILAKIIFKRNHVSFQKVKREMYFSVLIGAILLLLITDTILFIIYSRIYRPFTKLQKFASNIARGNFDAPLLRQKHNYFGAFTESFDIMRTELKAAKEGEAAANRSKKELVASLSHDIKTPISTIKAICEILEIKLMKSLIPQLCWGE